MSKTDTTAEVNFISDEARELAKNIRDQIEGKFCGRDPRSQGATAILAHDIQLTINKVLARTK